METSLYLGFISHIRLAPFEHHFKYPLFMILLDLDELPSCFNGIPGWSTNKLAIAQFRRSDYYGDPKKDLTTAIRELVKERSGLEPKGPIKLLTHLRYFWHNFNPVSFYYCYDESGKNIQAIVAEVSNTPWREKSMYVLSGENLQHEIVEKKVFHVSPFLPMDMQYCFRFNIPSSQLRVHITAADKQQDIFSADLFLEKKALTPLSGIKILMRYPAMSIQVILKIYWQALKLKRRGAQFYDHPTSKGF